MRSEVDRQVRVVGDEQARGLQVVHAAHEPHQVGQLARQAVAVRLGEDDVVQLGMLGEHRAMEVEQVAVQRRDPGGRQHDPVAPHPEMGEEQPGDAEDRPGEQVFEPAHPPGQARMRTTMFWPSSVVSASLMSCAMTSATWLGCMILVRSSSGASLRRRSVAVRPGEML